MKQLSLRSGDTQRSPRALVLLLGLAVVVLVLAGCTISAAQQPAARPAAPTAAAPAAAPTAAVPTVAPTAAAPQVAPTATAPAAEVDASTLPLGSYTNDKTEWGTVVLTLADGGQFTLHIGLEDRLIRGIWKATGDQFEFTATDGACPNIKGTYKWALDGEALSFKQVHDSCSYNTAIFDSQTWIRQP